MRLILHLLVIAAIAYILSQVLPGVRIKSFGTAVIFAVVLGLLNVFLRPLLILITLPLTIFSFGLFIFVINTIIVMIAGEWIKNFDVDTFWHALLFSLILSLTTSTLFREEKRQRGERSS